jgi:hypothetical protein
MHMYMKIMKRIRKNVSFQINEMFVHMFYTKIYIISNNKYLFNE